MTIEEKRGKLKELCESHPGYCTNNGTCPLFQQMAGGCKVGSCNDEDIEEAYRIAFGEDEDKCGVAKAMEVEKLVGEMVNHPSHYNNGGMECIDEMILIFGKEATMNFCLCNAWKYRYRANAKNGQEDLDKANWYIAKYKELRESV